MTVDYSLLELWKMKKELDAKEDIVEKQQKMLDLLIQNNNSEELMGIIEEDLFDEGQEYPEY